MQKGTKTTGDLNLSEHPDNPGFGLGDYSAKAGAKRIHSHFRNIEDALCGYIDQAHAVVGCVAWITSDAILRALARKDAVSLVVQKEDFLRPDYEDGPEWSRRHNAETKARYDRLKTFDKHEMTFARTEIGSFSSCSCEIPAVRCFGLAKGSAMTTPRMHHKFMVFLRRVEHEGGTHFEPYAVWTGSFNPTKNGTRSLENAVYIEDFDGVSSIYGPPYGKEAAIALSYFYEWAEIVVLSEPLDWTSNYVEPEWRIGS